MQTHSPNSKIILLRTTPTHFVIGLSYEYDIIRIYTIHDNTSLQVICSTNYIIYSHKDIFKVL